MLEEYFQWFSVMSFLCLWAVYGLTSCGRGNRMPRKVDDPELRKKKLNDVSKKETAQRTSSTYEKTEDASKKGKLLAPRESDSVRHRRGKSKKNTKGKSTVFISLYINIYKLQMLQALVFVKVLVNEKVLKKSISVKSLNILCS